MHATAGCGSCSVVLVGNANARRCCLTEGHRCGELSLCRLVAAVAARSADDPLIMQHLMLNQLMLLIHLILLI